MKKGQGLSVNMMIIVALGLVVLVISIILVTKQFRKGDTTITDVTKCPVDCVTGTACGDGFEQSYRTCEEPGQICCIKPQVATPTS